jgi:uncharacterized membrane-anchored protein YhcB (DUF1043 family)
MMNMGPMHFESMMMIPMIFMFLFNIVIIGLVIYFLISVIRFMKRKTRNDEELNQKLDRIIELHENENIQK